MIASVRRRFSRFFTVTVDTYRVRKSDWQDKRDEKHRHNWQGNLDWRGL